MPRPSFVFAAIGLFAVAGLAESAHAQDPYVVVVRPYYRGYWNAVADAIDAQGRFLVNEKMARLLGEEVKRERLVTARMTVEYWDWQRRFVARSNEMYRKELRERQLRRIVEDPSPEEIYSGSALNRLLDELIKRSRDSSEGWSEEVMPEWLDHIHVTSNNSKVGANGHPGLLKASKIRWSIEVEYRDDLSNDRAEIEKLLVRARSAILRGDRPLTEISALRSDLDRLHEQYRRELHSGSYRWDAGSYVHALETVRELQSAVDLLNRVDAARYLRPIKGTTVSEVVRYVTGLKFAAAMAGD
jgi:hypothetical protein